MADAQRRTVLAAEASASPWFDLIDHLACGVVLFDAQDRVVLCNEDFRRLYGPVAALCVPGAPFEDILRMSVAKGLVPEAAGRVEAWIAERMRAHAQPGEPIIRCMADGRWRQITERRLPDGRLLAFSVDVTEQMRKSQQLEAALQELRLNKQRMEDAVEALPAAFELWDAEDRLVIANSELRRLYPAIASLLAPGMVWSDLVRTNHAAGGLEIGTETLDAYIARRWAERHAGGRSVHKTGEGRWINVIDQPTRDGGVAVIRLDITELREQRELADRARELAEAAQRRLTDAIEALSDGFALYDAQDRLVVCNTRYREIYAASAQAIRIGASFEDILRHGLAHGQYPQADADPQAWLASRLHGHRNPGEPQLQELPGNRWMRIDERRTHDGGVAGVRADVTELVRREQQLVELNARLDEANAKLEQLAQTDGLTGIANRRQFDLRLAQEWARLVRHRMPLALLMIDVDHFKLYNDSYGHQAGDACLQKVAGLLKNCVGRATDLVARYGGEEFAVLLPHVGQDDAQAVARRCMEAVRAAGIAHRASPVAGTLTLSIGAFAVQEGEAGAHERLVHSADMALYRAKAAGRNRIEFA